MKTRLLFFLGIIIILFTSCKLNSESNYKPDIQFVHDPIVNDTVTLNIYADQGGVYRLDTISVGDTVHFQIYATGFTNNLTEFYLTESSDSVSKFILPSVSSMDSIFLPTSNYKTGKFIMAGTYTALFFPFQYVALKVSNEAKITFSVVSDANFEYNQFSFVLKTPIIAAKEKMK